VEAQVSRPGVQHGGESKLRTEALVVTAEGEESSAARREQGVEEQLAVAQREAVDVVVWDGEDNVEVINGEQARLAAFDPPELRERLARWAMPVAARVVDRPLVAAVDTHVHTAAQHRRPASRHVAEHLALYFGQRVLCTIGLTASVIS
jgi:hypothetical protein